MKHYRHWLIADHPVDTQVYPKCPLFISFFVVILILFAYMTLQCEHNICALSGNKKFLLDMKQERKASQRDAFLPVSNLACSNKCYFCRQCTYIIYVIITMDENKHRKLTYKQPLLIHVLR